MATVFECSRIANTLRRRIAPRVFVALLFAPFASCLPAESHAQQYQADQPDEKLRAQLLFVQNLARNPAGYSTESEKVKAFFNAYYFPSMTQFGPNDLAELGDKRNTLFNRILWPTTSEELQSDVTKVAFDKTKAIAFSKAKNYHPAVRYNAILILGMLDERYPIDQGANRRPSVPHREANKLLIQFVDYAAGGKAVEPSWLVGALVGLERHAKFRDSLDRDSPAAMTAALLKLLALEDLTPQADRRVAEWIRIQAATVLARLGSPGPNGEVNAALVKLLAGETEPKLTLDGRCQAASLLGLLNYQGAKVDGAATAAGVLQLVNDVVTAEGKEAQGFEQLHLGGFNEGPPPMGRATLDPETREPKYERRTLLARLSDVRRALDATKPVVPAEEQAKYDAVIAAIQPVIDAGGNTGEVDLQLAQKINMMASAVQQALNPSAAPAAAEVTEDVF